PGEKRNRGADLARGDLVAHWDDDDWIAPDRLRLQVEELLAAGADACGARDVLHFRVDSGDAWLYRCPANEPRWLAGGTLLYRRAAWADHPFPPLRVGEDAACVRRLPTDGLHTLAESSGY